jgi:hypothetical protein
MPEVPRTINIHFKKMKVKRILKKKRSFLGVDTCGREMCKRKV